MYKYHFTSTIKDLLDAEEADTTQRTVRKSLRWAVGILVGFFGLIFIVSAESPKDRLLSLLPFSVCCYLIYHWIIASYIRRRQIRRDNAPSQEVKVEFRDDCVEFELGEYGTFKRHWQELVLFSVAPRGVLLFFTDGTVNWLPNRVFADDVEKNGLGKYLTSQTERFCDIIDVDND